MDNDPNKRDWVARVLGYRFADNGAGGLSKARARWLKARADVDASLAGFRTSLMGNSLIKDDPRFAFVRAAAAEIPRMLPAPGRQIDALLAAKEADAATVQKTVAALDAYRKELAAARSLARLEEYADSTLKQPLALRATLGAAIDEIETLLRAA